MNGEVKGHADAEDKDRIRALAEGQVSDRPLEDDENRYHVAASPSESPEVHVLKHDDTFAVLDRFGDISRSGDKQGVYHQGTRFVSLLRLRLQGQRPLLLSSNVLADNVQLRVELTNPDLYDQDRIAVPHGTLHLARSKLVQDATYFERLTLSNYSHQAVLIEVTFEFASDFVDVFEVRGTPRAARGAALPPLLEPNAVTRRYRGLDGVLRQTRFEFAPAPGRLDATRGTCFIRLESKERQDLQVWARCAIDPIEGAERRAPLPFDVALGRGKALVAATESDVCRIVTSNEEFNDWLQRSEADLRMLRTETADGPYPYAGVPWFSTPFGRDGIWTALEVLWFRPELARGVLKFLSHHQAKDLDPSADAEPGKILHEMRSGEMAALHEIPFGLYYGSIDSTPLYLMLAAKYYETTGDLALIASIWPNLMAALEWMETYGDVDGDGFIEYGRKSRDGLVQQGWKDSNDSVFHRDGSLAAGPIALAEVQGYAYAGLRGLVTLGRALGQDAVADQCERTATALRGRFDAAFFCDDIGTYALALDMQKAPCRVRTSNAGHCLYTGIALPERAERVVHALMSETMFSGWGIRTLACDEWRYNPISYHNGSIWPHDTAIVAAGMAAFGHRTLAAQILTALFEATRFMSVRRLPELFCGFPREPGLGPTLYPVACSPQAWAAGAVFMLLASVLGLEIDAVQKRLTFRHALLPPFLDTVEIQNLRVGDASLDLRLRSHADDVGMTVLRKHGTLEVLAIK